MKKKIDGDHETCLKNLMNLIDEMLIEYPTIRFLSIGLPAAIFEGKPFFAPDYPVLQGVDLKKILLERTGLHSSVENDVNCMVKGYAINHDENVYTDIVYIFLGENGPGTGILNNGDVIKGASGFAGELGFIPINNDENLCSVIRNGNMQSKIEAFGKTIAILSCVVNTKFVIFGGKDVNSSFCCAAQKYTEKFILKDRIPECLYTDNVEEDYFSGLVNIGFSIYFNEIELH